MTTEVSSKSVFIVTVVCYLLALTVVVITSTCNTKTDFMKSEGRRDGTGL